MPKRLLIPFKKIHGVLETHASETLVHRPKRVSKYYIPIIEPVRKWAETLIVISAAFATVALGFGPASWLKTDAYKIVLAVLPIQVWGILWIIAGLLLLIGLLKSIALMRVGMTIWIVTMSMWTLSVALSFFLGWIAVPFPIFIWGGLLRASLIFMDIPWARRTAYRDTYPADEEHERDLVTAEILRMRHKEVIGVAVLDDNGEGNE